MLIAQSLKFQHIRCQIHVFLNASWPSRVQNSVFSLMNPNYFLISTLDGQNYTVSTHEVTNTCFFLKFILTVKGSKMGYFSSVSTLEGQDLTLHGQDFLFYSVIMNHFLTLYSLSTNLHTFYACFCALKWKIFNPLHCF